MAKKQLLPLIASANNNTRISTAGREDLVNWFIETYPDPVSGRQGVMIKSMPGLSLWTTLDVAGEEIRAMMAHKNVGYTVLDNDLWTSTSTPVDTDRANLTTSTGRCSICALNDEIIICDGTDAYSYLVTANTFATISSGLPANVKHVVAHSGFVLFLLKDSNKVYVSNVADARTIASTSYFTVSPDFSNLVSAATTSGLVYIFTGGATKIYWPSGNAVVPFDPTSGGYIQIGCEAQHSPLVINDTVYWLGKTDAGIIGVCRAKGIDYEVISTPSFTAGLRDYVATDDAYAWSDTHDGHIFYNLTFPSVTDTYYDYNLGVTWSYDTTNGSWSRREAFDTDLNEYTRHWAAGSMNVAGKQIVGGYRNGKLYEINMDYVDDDGEEIIRKFVTPHLLMNGKRFTIYGLQIFVEPNKATASVTEPQLMLEISKDYGNTWSNIRTRTVSTTGSYPNQARFNTLGSSEVFTFRISVSDPISWTITSIIGEIEANMYE